MNGRRGTVVGLVLALVMTAAAAFLTFRIATSSDVLASPPGTTRSPATLWQRTQSPGPALPSGAAPGMPGAPGNGQGAAPRSMPSPPAWDRTYPALSQNETCRRLIPHLTKAMVLLDGLQRLQGDSYSFGVTRVDLMWDEARAPKSMQPLIRNVTIAMSQAILLIAGQTLTQVDVATARRSATELRRICHAPAAPGPAPVPAPAPAPVPTPVPTGPDPRL
jgi:hypothetical protein